MFASLRHDAFVSSDNEHHHVNPMHAGEHVLYKPLVSRHVYKAKSYIAGFECSEPNINRYASFLLFLEPISVSSGKRFDERSFSVIDVTSRAYDNAPGHALL